MLEGFYPEAIGQTLVYQNLAQYQALLHIFFFIE